tara:strand:+ start:134 stop:253 length:120 start_codon:yes stop_codon:yes gene_type:complete
MSNDRDINKEELKEWEEWAKEWIAELEEEDNKKEESNKE